jgi:RNA polymerase sigma factor (TIGR02999 family)
VSMEQQFRLSDDGSYDKLTARRMSPPPTPVTQLLQEWRSGNQRALEDLIPLVYNQLRALAGRFMQSERPDHTLRATALVNEAYLKLVHADVPWEDRVHFFAVAARVMRRILVDHAKANRRAKRGAGAGKVSLDEALVVSSEPSGGLLELDDAMDRLATFDRRKSDLVELLYFGGLTYDEAAEALKISPATVHRELKLAKAWLYQTLNEPGAPRMDAS